MPIDFYLALRVSIPLAFVWTVVLGIALYLFRAKALWLLVAAPLALYWPIWLSVYGLPACYYSGNCV